MIKHARKITSHLVLSVFLVMPFFYNNYIFYGTYAVKEVFICLAALLAVILWFSVPFKSGPAKINPYVFVCGIFMAALLMSGMGNPDINRVLFAERLIIWLALLILPAVCVLPDFKKMAVSLIVSNIVITAACALQGLLFVFGNTVSLLGHNDFGGRLYSVFGNPDLYAAYLVAVLPVLYYAYDKTKRKSILALVFINAGFMFLTQSAAGALTLSVLVLIWAFTSLKGYKKIITAAAALIVMAFALWALSALKSDSAVMRWFLWDSSVKMAAAHPVTGVGAGNYRIFAPDFQAQAIREGNYPDYVSVHDEAYAHNDVMQFLSEAGIAGCAAFLLLVLFPFILYLRNKDKKTEDGYIVTSLAGILIFSMANFPFEMPFIAALYMIFAFKITSSSSGWIIRQGIVLKSGKGVLAACAAYSVFIFVPDYMERGYLVSYMSYAATKELKVSFDANSKAAWRDYQLSFYTGIMKSRQGEYKGAVLSFKRALELFPGFAGAMYNLGNAYYNSGDLTNAALYYRKLIALSRAYVPAYNNLALIEKRNNNYGEAIKLLLEAEKWNSALVEVKYNLADAFYLSGNKEKSTEYLKKALKIKPDYEPALLLAGKIGFKP